MKGAVDLVNNWSVGGRTRHIQSRIYFLRQLKENGELKVVWKKGVDNSADLFTKNLPGPAFHKHTAEFCGEDEYYMKKK